MDLNLHIRCGGCTHIKYFLTCFLEYCVVFKSSHVVIWQVPDFPPAVRDLVMNRTFTIISPHFQRFEADDWSAWFLVKLVPVLPSFSPMMLKNATSNINCTNYRVVWVAFHQQARFHHTKVQNANEGLDKKVSFHPLQCEWDSQSIPCNAVA